MTTDDVYDANCVCKGTPRPDGDEDDHDVAIIDIITQVTCCDGTMKDTMAECAEDKNGSANGCYTCCDGTTTNTAAECPEDKNGEAE